MRFTRATTRREAVVKAPVAGRIDSTARSASAAIVQWREYAAGASLSLSRVYFG